MSVKLTESALQQVKAVINQERPFLRIGIRGQSCSGPVYSFGLEKETNSSDEIFVQDGVTIIHEKKFSEELKSIVVDYKEVEDKKGFVFINPLQIACNSCCSGCA